MSSTGSGVMARLYCSSVGAAVGCGAGVPRAGASRWTMSCSSRMATPCAPDTSCCTVTNTSVPLRPALMLTLLISDTRRTASPTARDRRNCRRPPAHMRRGRLTGGRKPPRLGCPSGPMLDCRSPGRKYNQCHSGGRCGGGEAAASSVACMRRMGEGYQGGKSGYTDPAKQTVVSIFNLPLGKEGLRPIAITLLQSSDREKDVEGILKYLKRNIYYGGATDANTNWIQEKIGVPDIKEPNFVTLVFGGDIMLDRGVRSSVVKNFNNDYSALFAKKDLSDILKKSDIVFANLEGTASDKGADYVSSKYQG